MSLTSYRLSPPVVWVEGTDWEEPVLIWESVCMPTGSGKSPPCAYISKLLKRVHEKCGGRTSWLVKDATFEKMGAIMADNGCRTFGMYDELTTFLHTQINLYKGRGLRIGPISAAIQWSSMDQEYRYDNSNLGCITI